MKNLLIFALACLIAAPVLRAADDGKIPPDEKEAKARLDKTPRHGEFVDTSEIAQRFRLSHAHVRRLLRFAYLAPDIVEAIIEGRQARSLTVKLLLRGIPLDWADQRAAFGLH